MFGERPRIRFWQHALASGTERGRAYDALTLTELNDVAFGISTVAHAITLKVPLPIGWEEFAAMQVRN